MAEENKGDDNGAQDDLAAKLLKNMDGNEGDNQNKISNKDLAYVFLQNRDNFPAKPYYEDGNPDMYLRESIEKRKALY